MTTTKDKFLQQIAQYYIDKKVDLAQYCFVFPNKRSAMYMRKYIKEAIGETPAFMPEFTTMSNFMSALDDATLASQTELIFILYKVYCDVLKNHGREEQIRDFDKFIVWGDMMLRDFDDVDAYIVDPKQLFRNIKNEREISANYLTQPQIEAIEHIWGKTSLRSDVESFWNHVPSNPKDQSASDQFLHMWQILGEIYEEFKSRLATSNPPLTYSGNIYRSAYYKIKEMSVDEFDFNKYVFVGFNQLSTAQTLIFKRMKALGIAEFFWDVASPYFYDQEGKISEAIKATRFIAPNLRSFPMPEDFELKALENSAKIDIVPIATNVGQTKAACSILTDWVKSEIIDKDDLLNTSIVLSDESLLMPMLYSLPQEIDSINITMGLSLSTTPFAALLSSIISLQIRARQIHGEYQFYYDDVLSVLSHPHIRLIAAESANKLSQYISKSKQYNIKAKEIVERYPDLSFLFRIIEDDNDISAIRDYVINIIDELKERFTTASPNQESSYEIALLDGYRKGVEELCYLVDKYSVTMVDTTFFKLLERSLRGMQINLKGTPLKGMQVMGVLETRSLDFDNVVMLSMNERIFPKKQFANSLIPANLRRGYGLPTIDSQEAVYSYHFYRLLSRAKHVKLLYDSRTSGVKSGEMSRYLYQLLNTTTGDKVRLVESDFGKSYASSREITVNKTPEVLAELRRFKPGGDLNLSASALKTYIECPLKFYLQSVKRLRADNETVDYMDNATYGTIVHKVAEKLYSQYKDIQITETIIDKILDSDIKSIIINTVNELYHQGRYTDRYADMPGESKVLIDIIEFYIRAMLSVEKGFTPFTFKDAEFGGRYEWKINDRHTINFKMSIDRIDSMPDGSLRIIDYKTGSDDLKVSSIEKLFDIDKKKTNPAIFQLMTYCKAYSDLTGCKADIQPMIYLLRTILTEGIKPLTVNKIPLVNYKDYVDEFFVLFQDMIDQIFEEENEYPFNQTTVENNCLYCDFVKMCARNPKPPKIR